MQEKKMGNERQNRLRCQVLLSRPFEHKVQMFHWRDFATKHLSKPEILMGSCSVGPNSSFLVDCTNPVFTEERGALTEYETAARLKNMDQAYLRFSACGMDPSKLCIGIIKIWRLQSSTHVLSITTTAQNLSKNHCCGDKMKERRHWIVLKWSPDLTPTEHLWKTAVRQRHPFRFRGRE